MDEHNMIIIDRNSRIVLLFCRVFLVNHFRFFKIGTGMWEIYPWRKLLVTYRFVTVFLIVCSIFVDSTEELGVVKKIEAADVERNIEKFSIYAILVTVMLSRESDLLQFFRIIHQVEQTLRLYRQHAKWRKSDILARNLLFLLMLTTVTVFVWNDLEINIIAIRNSNNFINAEASFLQFGLTSLMLYQIFALQFQVTYLACVLGTRMRCLSHIVGSRPALEPAVPASESSAPSLILRLCRLHDRLRTAVLKLNRAYNVLLFFSFVHKIVEIICNASFLILSSGPIGRLGVTPVTIACHLFVQSVWLIIIIESCHRITIQEREFVRLLKTQISPNGVVVRVPGSWTHESEAIWRHIQLCSEPSQMTVTQVFVIGRPLIYSIAGAVITYLLVLLQAQKGC